MAARRQRSSRGATTTKYGTGRPGETPPTTKPYKHTPKAPPPTYTDEHGVKHRTDGECHGECRDWR